MHQDSNVDITKNGKEKVFRKNLNTKLGGVRSLDDKTRGFIESIMDETLQGEALVDIDWVEEEVPISSLRDLALGHVIGVLDSIGWAAITFFPPHELSAAEKKEGQEIIRALVRRRLPEIIEKIERELHR